MTQFVGASEKQKCGAPYWTLLRTSNSDDSALAQAWGPSEPKTPGDCMGHMGSMRLALGRGGECLIVF